MKLQKNSIRKIDISQINKTDNIRKQYDDIEQLARSIERDGQLQPIGVTQQEDDTFNILYGFRRYHAFLFLIDEGKPFNQIEAKITTGDPAIIQLIENIHRDDLKPKEFENALQALIDKGMSQKEISERLNIRITRISDALVARKERLKLQEKGVDTSEISTSAISQVRSLPEEKKAEVIKKAKKKGPTVKAVKEEIKKAKQEEIKENDIKSEIDHTEGYEIVDDDEQQAYVGIRLKEFFNLPEVKEIINKNNYMVQDKCEHCGGDIR
jgi:ParB family chromosome partitioning protein